MGADGHVKIYDAVHLTALIGGGVYGYHHEIFGRKVLVVYYGDSPIGYEVPPCLKCGLTDCADILHAALVERADAEALVATWEVWT